jgi:hypothetical protein
MNTFLIWVRQWFCGHKWEVVKEGMLSNPRNNIVVGYYQDYICKKCLHKVEIRW